VVTFASNGKLNRSGSSRVLSEHQSRCKAFKAAEKATAAEAALKKKLKANTPKKRKGSTSSETSAAKSHKASPRAQNPGKSPRSMLLPKQRGSSAAASSPLGSAASSPGSGLGKGNSKGTRAGGLKPSSQRSLSTGSFADVAGQHQVNPGKAPRSVPLPNQRSPVPKPSVSSTRTVMMPLKHRPLETKKRALAVAFSEEEDSAIVRHVEEWLVDNPQQASATMECWRQFDFTRDFISDSRHAEGMRTRYAKYVPKKAPLFAACSWHPSKTKAPMRPTRAPPAPNVHAQLQPRRASTHAHATCRERMPSGGGGGGGGGGRCFFFVPIF